MVAVTPENLPAIVDDKIKSAEHPNLSAEIDKENPVQINENSVDLNTIRNETDTILAAEQALAATLIQYSTADALSVDTDSVEKLQRATDDGTFADAVCPIGSPKVGDKRKIDDDLMVGAVVGGRSTSSNNGSDIKKARRVQNKIRCQTKINNNKTRSK